MHKKNEDNKNEEQLTEINQNAEISENNKEGVKPPDNEIVREPEPEKDPLVLLNEKIAGLEKENTELKDNLLRKSADFENFRKRMNKDKEESVKFANQMLLLDITETIDNFERAFKSAESNKDFNAFHDGIVLIEKKLIDTLENRWGVKRFSSDGEVFNPERHQAISIEDSTEHDQQIVLEDFQKGYLYYDRVLRPAKVKVSNPVTGDKSENNT